MIEVMGVDYGYGNMYDAVFHKFNLTIGNGGIYGLLGKNGTGKSTLLYLISGLLRCKGGMILVDGMDTEDRDPNLLKDIFLVPEEFELPRVRLSDYVAVNAMFYPRFSKDILSKCLAEFELDEDVRLTDLSMGQKKKVYVSFALACGTRLLLMDEPTNGLDIPSKAQFRKVVASQRDSDRTIIISTHQAHDVEALLSHIIMINQHGLLLNMSVKELSERFVFEYRQPTEMDNSVIYAEPTLQGNAVMAVRGEGAVATPVNIELLFNAVVTGKLKAQERLSERQETAV